MKTLVILNPRAGGDRAGKIFHRLEARLGRVLGDFHLVITHHPDEVDRQLEFVANEGIEKIISLGGDGTNHCILNALAKRPELDIVLGTIPLGTGQDSARTFGTPLDPIEAVDWLKYAKPIWCDLGRVDPLSQVFLTVASTGITRDVTARVNRSKKRIAACFFIASIESLLKYKPQRVTVECDGKLFFEGKSYLLAVANTYTFGRGMRIAPQALINDGLFDVVVIGAMFRLKAIASLPRLYKGTHLKLNEVSHTQASSVTVRSDEGPIELAIDGEEAMSEEVRFTIIPRALKVLMDPVKAAIQKEGVN